MNMSKRDKVQRLRDVRAYIADHKSEKGAYPKLKDISEAIGINTVTANRYKQMIVTQDRAELYAHFAENIITETEDLIRNIDANKILYKEIITNSDDDTTRINAAKTLIETQIDKLHIMRDGPEYLFSSVIIDNNNNNNNNIANNNSNNEQQPHNQTNKEQIYGPENSNSATETDNNRRRIPRYIRQ